MANEKNVKKVVNGEVAKPQRISNFAKRKHTPHASNTKEVLKKGEVFIYSNNISVAELANRLSIPVVDIIKFLFMQGKMVNINTTLDDDLIGLVCLNYGFDYKKEKVVSEYNFEDLEIVDDPNSLINRPAVVTIMGHVDHGKTTLLDAIRNSRVVEGEFGGITQHIGAYQVDIKGEKITFLDTPGHEAFSAMRARGSRVTDIVIIVVAADDGVMPQTIEAIDHAKAAKVPIIVAVNKIDKPGADPERIKMKLADLGLAPEEWGGNTIFVNISAKLHKGIDTLLETILTVAELAEFKANPNRYSIGTVIDAKLDKGRGPVATLLVQNGTLKVSDNIVVGASYGKIRQMRDDLGRIIKSAGPSKPVEITGLNDVPEAGDSFMAFADEKVAREIGEKRKMEKVESERKGSSALSLEDLNNRIKEGEIQTLNVIVKADVQGSAEAVKGALEKIVIEGVKIDVIRSQAGAITESDVILASASNAIIYGFNVRPDAVVRKKAEDEKVDIRLHRIIYDIVEEIEAAMKGMLKPVFKEVVTGQAEVRQLFKVSKVGTIAGCYITTGSIKRESNVRIIRQGVVIYEGKLSSLKRFQSDTKEVTLGYECGLTVENYNDLKEQDIIEGYIMQETKVE